MNEYYCLFMLFFECSVVRDLSRAPSRAFLFLLLYLRNEETGKKMNEFILC